MRGVLPGPSPSLTLLPVYDRLDVTVTSTIAWFHPNHDMVSRLIYRLPTLRRALHNIRPP